MTRAPEKMVTRPGRARTVLLALLALALGTALTACFGVPEDSPAPGEDEVLNLVALACPNEGWEVVRVEETREEPQQLVKLSPALINRQAVTLFQVVQDMVVFLFLPA